MKTRHLCTMQRRLATAIASTLTAIALSGCGSNTPKQQTEFVAPLTAFDYFDKGAEQYGLWEQTDTIVPLLLAEKYFAKSLEMQPDNINIQQAYYDTLVWASFATGNYSEASVEKVFNSLNPTVKSEATAPAKVTYARSSNNGVSANVLIPTLFRAIQQQPRDAHTWKELSEQYAELDNHWMAVATAEQAIKYAPDDPENTNRIAYAINGVIESRACNFEQKHLIKRSAFYAAKSAAADKENSDIAGLVGLQYLRLGLHPLANRFALQAYSQDQDSWNGSLLIDTYLNLYKYEEANNLAQSMLASGSDYAEPHRDTALYQASLGKWDKAALEYRKLLKKDNDNLYYHLIANWLQSVSNNRPLPLMLETVNLNNDWEAELYKYLSAETMPDTSPVDVAQDACELADAHFYTAMRYWRDDDTEKAKHHLKLTRKQGATWFQEHFWAGVMLKTL